MEMIVWT